MSYAIPVVQYTYDDGFEIEQVGHFLVLSHAALHSFVQPHADNMWIHKLRPEKSLSQPRNLSSQLSSYYMYYNLYCVYSV